MEKLKIASSQMSNLHSYVPQSGALTGDDKIEGSNLLLKSFKSFSKISWMTS
jgi:hypothetical protein